MPGPQDQQKNRHRVVIAAHLAAGDRFSDQQAVADTIANPELPKGAWPPVLHLRLAA
jgi:hypothetical protein